MSLKLENSSLPQEGGGPLLPPLWRDLQAKFAQAVVDNCDVGSDLSSWVNGSGVVVHRNTIVHGQVDALSAVFPTFQQLVGGDCFFSIVKDFFKRIPPSSPCLSESGGRLAGFVQNLPFVQSMPWLLDMIHLEWQLYCALHAAENSGFDPQSFLSWSPSDLDHAVFAFHPSVSFFCSFWPVNTIRLAHQITNTDNDFSHISLNSGPEYLAIFRNGCEAWVMPLDRRAFLFFKNCYAGLTLAAAAGDVMVSESDAVISDYLTTAFAHHWIIGATKKGGRDA